MNRQENTSMETFLNHMIVEVNKKRQALENECRILENLLKPWPAKKSVKDHIEQNDKAAPASDPEKAVYTLSCEEKEALCQVDELLKKAQKTRHLKSKAMSGVKDDSRQEQSTNFCKSSDVIDMEDGKSTPSGDKISEKQKETSNSAAPEHQLDINNASDNKNNSASREKKTSKSFLNNSVKKEQQCPTTSRNSSAASDVKLASQQRPYRPPSSGRSSRPASGQSKHKPVHMSAPFKTDENMKFPKRKPIYTKAPRSGPRMGPTPTSTRSIPAYKTLPHIKGKNVKQSEQTGRKAWFEDKNPNCVLEDADKDSEASLSHRADFSEHTPDEPNIDTPGNLLIIEEPEANSSLESETASELKSNTQDEAPALRLTEKSQNFSEIPSEIQNSAPPAFRLRKNGSSLKIPGHLKKLMSTNNNLRERCLATRLVRKVSPGDPAQQFVDRLCSQGEVGQELWTRFASIACLKSHEILLEELESLHLENLTENTTYEALYRAKRILEFVLSSFAEWQEEAEYISRVQFRPVSQVPGPQNIEGDNTAETWFSEGDNHQPGNDLHDHLQSSKQWAHLKFMEKYLQLNILLCENAYSEWWNHLICSDKRDADVFQGVYSLLTTCGQFLPALIGNPD